MIEADHECSDLKLKETFEHLQQGRRLCIVLTVDTVCRLLHLCVVVHHPQHRAVHDRQDKAGQGEAHTVPGRDGNVTHTHSIGTIVVL